MIYKIDWIFFAFIVLLVFVLPVHLFWIIPVIVVISTIGYIGYIWYKSHKELTVLEETIKREEEARQAEEIRKQVWNVKKEQSKE